MGEDCEKNTSPDEMQVKYEEMKKFVIELIDQTRHYTVAQVMAQGCQTDRAQILSYMALAIGALNFVLLWIVQRK